MSCTSSDDLGEKTAVLKGDQETLNKEIQKAKEHDACLIIIRGTPQGHRHFLTMPEMVIGRDPSADIPLSDQSVSRKHAKVAKENGKVKLTDMGSANGTVLNGKKLNPGDSAFLAKEDMIKLGNLILKFLPAGELEIVFYGNLGSAAHQDPMTRLYNKGYLQEALDAEFKRAKALHTELSMLVFDIDFFKKVNDTHGHDAGDYVLKEFASLLRSKHVRPKDILARFGGEEFVMLLPNTNAQTAQEIGETARAALEAYPFIYEGKRLPITCSVGVAEMTSEIEASQTLFKIADKALYASKQGGRNRVTVGRS